MYLDFDKYMYIHRILLDAQPSSVIASEVRVCNDTVITQEINKTRARSKVVIENMCAWVLYTLDMVKDM